MSLRWTKLAHGDLRRLHAFLEPVNPAAAARAVRAIISRVERIPAHPRLGERLPRFESREVRGVLVGDYEVRYELIDTDIVILRVFPSREDR